MTILILNIGDPVFLKTRKQVRPPRRSKLAIYQDERFDEDWDRLIKWDDVSDAPLDVMNAYGIDALWTGTFDWADQPQPEFVANDLFHEHFNTDWFQTDITPEGDLTVSGVAQYQQTLTADVSALSDADGLPDSSTYVYQWQHETSPDVFEDISGATATTYTTDRYDMGKRVRYRLQYVDLLQQAYADEAGISPTSTTVYSIATSVIPFTDIPVEGEPIIQNTTAIAVAAEQGHTLVANVSNIFDFNQPISDYSYQWFREDALNSGNYVEIPDATGQYYTVQAEDIHPATNPTDTANSGGNLKVRVQYTDNLGKLEEVFSAPFLTGDSPFSGTPEITLDTAVFDVGTQLTAVVSGLQDQNNPLSHEYQWYAEVYGNPGTFLPIDGATASTFDITEDFEKRKIYLEVTTTDASGNVYISQSAETARVNSLPDGAPSIVGTFEVGQTITASNGNLSDYDTNISTVTKYYVFYRGDTVDGPWSIVRGQSTTPTYSVQAADINKYIRVRVSYTDSLGKQEEAFSAPILIVNSSPVGVPVIQISSGGNAQVGKTLTADMTGVSDVNQPLGAYSYQWYRRLPGGAYSEISGATSSTYVVPAEDGGQEIKVEVSFEDSGGVTETVVSAAVPVLNSLPTGDMTTVLVEGGDPEAGKTLQVDASGISDVNGVGPLSYQWYSSSKYHHGSTAESAISGATSDSYIIQPADAGKEIFAKVSYTDQFPVVSGQDTYSFDTRLDAEAYIPDSAGLLCHLDAQLYNTASPEQIEDMSPYKDNGFRYVNNSYSASNGGIFNLTGGSYINLPHSQLKDLGSHFTISCYMYINKSQTHIVFSNMDVTSYDWGNTKGLRWQINNGAFWMQSGRGVWDWSGGYASGPAVPTSGYYLVNLVVAGTDAKFYANGTQYGGGTFNRNIYFAGIHDDSVNIGRAYTGNQNGSYYTSVQPMSFSYFSVNTGAMSASSIKDMSNAFANRRTSQTKPARFFVPSPATGQPTISGRTTVDAILSSDVSAIADLNGLNTFSYQWLRDGAPISGATSDTYTVQDADFEKNITLRISYTDRAGYSETPTSEPLYIVSRPPEGSLSIANTTSPGNSPQVTHVLEANLSLLSDPDGMPEESITYYWFSNNVQVQSGTGNAFKQYTVQPSDYGQSIVLKISYTDALGNVEDFNTYGWLTSAGVTVVNSPVTGEVYILNAQLEQASQEEQYAVITADPSALRDINEYDDLTPDSFTYQWRRNGSNISGQTGQSYAMQWMDHGDQITVRVSFTDDEGNVESVVSSNSVTLKNTAPTGDVVISGEPRVGKVLTADPSSIEDPNYFGPISNYMSDLASYSSNYSTTSFQYGSSIPTSDQLWSSDRSQRGIYHNRFGRSHTITETVYFDEVTPVWQLISYVGGGDSTRTTINHIKWRDVNGTWHQLQGSVAVYPFTWMRYAYGSTSNNPWLATAIQYQTTAGYNSQRNRLWWYIKTGQSIADAASYQWHRDDGNGPVDIPGATESTYTLVEDDYAKNITCTVSYTDAHGTAESVTSSMPVLVDATGYPSIDGSPDVGATLTANLSAMQDVQGFTNLVYHWEAKQLDDADYSVVSTGADQDTFVIPVGYDAAEIRLRVTYDDGDFATSDFFYVRSDVTGDLVMSGPSSPDYYVGDVVLADASNIEDINGLPSNDQIAYEWYRGVELVSPQTQSVIYEQAITVTSNNAISNHLFEVTLDTAALVSAGKMHSDSYVHFYDEAGNKIPYWFEGPANSARSTYWLKMDLPAGSANIVARYCGDADFAKFSSDASVMGFTFFEDFENGIDNWERTGADDAFQVNQGGLSGLKTSGYLQSVAKYSSPIIARAVSISTNAPANGFTPLGFWNDRYDQVSIKRETSNVHYLNNNGSYDYVGNFYGLNTFIKDEIVLTGTQALVRGFSDVSSYDSGFFTHTQGNKPLFLGIRGDLGQSGSNYHSTLDTYVNQGYSISWSYIHVRPYVAGLTVSVTLGAETSFVGSVYNVEPNDTGSDLHVVMSYTDLQGYAESVTSPTIAVSNSPFFGAVRISGSPYTGETLTADTSRLGDVDGLDGTSYTYQWSANGQALTGETASTFAVTNAYVNQSITVEVSFADNTGAPSSATSPGVTILNTPSTGEPVLNGTASVGEDLSIDMSSVADVDGPISNVTYAWYESTARNVLASRDTLIAGAESSTFTIPAGYEAKEVKALVSYDDTKGESKSRYAPAPAFPEQDLDFYIDAGSKDSYALGTTDVYDLTQDALAMTVDSSEWSNINNGRLASSTTKRALQNASRLHDLGNDFTISALAYIDLTGYGKDNVFLSCMQYNSNVERYEGYMFYFDEAENRLSLRLGAPGVTNNNQGVYYFRSGGQITSSGFYLVSVAVQNYNSVNPTVDFFVNGNLSGSRVFGDGAFHSAIYYDFWNQRVRQPLYADVSEPVLIGGMNNTGNVGYGSQNFDIGMLSVHRRALSDAEMAEMYSTFSDRITGSVSRKLIAAPLVGAPTISGTPQVGYSLVADASSITDANEIPSVAFTWYANGEQLGTGSSRALTANEFDKQITVKATYVDRAGYLHEIESAPVQVVNTPATGTVAISGTPEVGQELTAVTSAISDANGKPVNAEDFTYQWYVNDALVTTAAVHPKSVVRTSDENSMRGQSPNGELGHTVALSADGSILVAGAPRVSLADNSTDGEIYIYKKDVNGYWSETDRFSILDYSGYNLSQHDDVRLGESEGHGNLYISNDNQTIFAAGYNDLAVAATIDPATGQRVGDLSVLTNVETNYWKPMAMASGSKTVVHADALDDNRAGRVWIKETSDGITWTGAGGFVSPDTSVKQFGHSVSINDAGDTIVIGATGLDNNVAAADGVYVATRNAWADWTIEELYINRSGNKRIGWDVSISGDGNTIIFADNAGTAFQYKRENGSWSQESTFSIGVYNSFLVRRELNYDGTRFLVLHSNTASLYQKEAGTWSLLGTAADTSPYNGWVSARDISISADGSMFAYGNPSWSHPTIANTDAGRVSVFELLPDYSHYTVQSDDIFQDVRVDVSFTDNQGNAEGPIASTPVSIGNSEPQGAFTIQGGTNAGDLVYVDVSGITDANGVGNDWSFQWKSDGVAIPGATNADYTLTNADPHVLTVDGSYTDQQGTREHLSSSNTILQQGFTISSYPYDIDGDMSNLPTARATAGRTDSHNNTNSVRSIDSNDQTIEMVGYYKASSTGTQNFSASHIKSYLWIGDAAKKAVPSVSEALINSNISKEASVSLEAGKYYPVRFLAHKKAEDAPQVLTTTREDGQTISNGNWAYELPAISSNQVVTSSVGVRYNFTIMGLPGGVRVSLYSPSGTSTTLWHPQTTSSIDIAEWYWGYATEAFAGEPANGVWWLRFTHDSHTASWSATIARAGVRIYTDGVNGNSVLKHNDTYNGTNFYYSGLVAHNTWQEQDSPAGTVSISGSPGAGHTLSALLAGDWASESGHVYQWTLDGDDVYEETNSTFVVPSNKVGSSVGLRVGFFSASGAVSSAEATPVVITNSPPLGALTVTGDPYANSTLTVNPAFTDAEGINEATRAYTWYRNDAVHATGTSYTTVVGDIDATFYVEASYTDNEGEAHTIASDPFTIVNAPPQGSVTIAGLFRAGETVTATVSGLDDADGVTPNTTSYQWMRGVEEIAGATALSYELQVADIGELVKMEVRYTDDLGKAEVLSSDLNFVVGRPPVLDNPQADQEAFVGLPFSYTVPADTFSDPDGHDLSYSASLADDSALPAWLSFDAPSRTFAGTPPDVLQTIDLKVVAADSEYSVSDEFALTIHARVSESFEDFDPPVVSGEAAPSTEEGNTAVASYSADKTVSWSVAGADAAFFSISTDGVLTFSSAPAYDASDADGNNVYEVTVKATDSSGNVGEQAVSVTVLEAPGEVTDAVVFSLNAADGAPVPGSPNDRVYASSINGPYEGIVHGDTVYSSSNGAYFQFDGTYTDVAVDLDVIAFSSEYTWSMGTGAFTAEAWVQREGSNLYVMQSSTQTAGSGWFLQLTESSVFLAKITATPERVFGSFSSNTNEWYHIVAVRGVTDADSAVYVNGQAVSTNSTMAGSALGNDGMAIGYAALTEPLTGAGKVALARVHNRALSAEEAAQNFNATKSRFGL